jgi:peptidoglycan/LPS O-acetylase OafA/YrhL
MAFYGSSPAAHRSRLNRDKREYHSLDAMRGVAAVMVVFVHCGVLWGGWQPASAYLAVDLFFILSGFVLEHAYGHRLAGSMTAFGFLKARLIRLYPLYLLGFAMGFASIILLEPWPGMFVRAVPAALMLPTPTSDGAVYPFNQPAWTLFIELLVNMMFALWWRRLRPATLLSITLVSGAIFAWSILHKGNADFGSSTFTLVASLPRGIFSFFAGVWLCRLQSGEPRPAFLGLMPPLLLVVALVINPGVSRSVYDLLVVVLVCPLLIYGGSLCDPPRRCIPVYRFLGLISYPIYILHYPMVVFVHEAGEHFRLPVAIAFQIGMVAQWAGISWIAAVKFDRPARAALSRAFGTSSASG